MKLTVVLGIGQPVKIVVVKSDRVIVAEQTSQSQSSITKQAVDIASQKRSLHFNIDPESGILVVQVFDDSGQLIRQIPHEEMMSLTQHLDEVRGMLFDDTI